MTAHLDVYVAGSSRDLERAERVIAALRAIPGVIVPVDWPAMMREHGPDEGLTPEQRHRFALEDAVGAEQAYVLVLLRPTPETPTAGAWVEFGIAIGASRARFPLGHVAMVIIAGKGTACIFDALVSPESVVDTDDEAIEIVRRIAEARAT